MKQLFFPTLFTLLLLVFACGQDNDGVVERNINADRIPQGVEVADAFPSITVEKAQSMIDKNKNLMILDVRTAGEFHGGHIKGAHLLDVTQDSSFMEGLKSFDPSKTYLVYCRSGQRSRKACNLMQENGIQDVYNLDEGYLGWPQPE
ncbi:MAG: rhodanese-like domain-containing protein [Saprospiraceae bacterium]|nr:rhodanese-like domain-containing protein [Saprospiraceae bacterium]